MEPMFDAVVVGAGPSGSSAARVMSHAGLSVLLLDRESFPRYKTCGGGIIGVTRGVVPEGFPVREEITEVTFSTAGRRSVRRRSPAPVMSTVARPEFDDWLVRLAVDAGAGFRPSTGVRRVVEAEGGVEIETLAGETLRARYVVDASGTSSRIARDIGVSLRTADLGLEREVDPGPEVLAEWRGRVHLDWGPIPGSYAWVFPKADSLTVGVIAAKGRPEALRDYLDAFVRDCGLDRARVIHDSGHLTRCRGAESPLGRGRVLLVGDAAGLLEPWTREGLSFATRSGTIAGEVIAAAAANDAPGSVVAAYTARLEESILPEMDAGFAALTAFERRPHVFQDLLAHGPLGWGYFTRLTRGETNLAHSYRRRGVRLALRWASRGSMPAA